MKFQTYWLWGVSAAAMLDPEAFRAEAHAPEAHRARLFSSWLGTRRAPLFSDRTSSRGEA